MAAALSRERRARLQRVRGHRGAVPRRGRAQCADGGGPMIRPALVFALAAVLAPAAVHAEAIALTGATVHTVSGPTIENATIVIQDGRIAAVGPNAAVPAGATIVSCAGKHIYPGFIDANSILGLVEVGSVRGTVDDAETGDINPNIRSEEHT